MSKDSFEWLIHTRIKTSKLLSSLHHLLNTVVEYGSTSRYTHYVISEPIFSENLDWCKTHNLLRQPLGCSWQPKTI